MLGYMMIIAARVAQELNLGEGYRIVSNSGKNAHQTIHNLYLDVIGGQQLTWPPFTKPTVVEEESKDAIPASPPTVDELFTYEMGFTLLVQAMIDAKKPIVGHNCMYDWLYIYNQFIGPLPDTYAEFSLQWNKYFPHTYDTKTMASNSKAFYNTSLGQVYEKCTNDDKFKNNLRMRFDTKNQCSNYDG